MKTHHSQSWVRLLMAVLPLVAVLLWVFWQQRTEDVSRAPDGLRVAELKQPGSQASEPVLAAFGAWLTAGRHEENLSAGLTLAKARRLILKELIQTDPQAALAEAVPYSVRQRLPEAVVALLEKPVSTTADLDVHLACGGAGVRSQRQQWLTLEGQRVQVFTYGERAEVMTKQKLSVHGIALDEVMAMLDDPLRELPPEEVADRGVSGRVVQVGKRLFEVASDDALAAVRERLRQTEEVLGPLALPAYRELAEGQIEGVYPLAMQDGPGSSDEDLPPVVYSPHTEGAKTMLYIRARFADELPTYEPVSATTAQARQEEAEAFWQDNSYGKSTLTTTYTSVVTLPKNGSEYVGDFNTLHVDARAAALAANASWNHANFSFYTVITSNPGNAITYSGIAQLGGTASHLLRSFISVRTASHEYGHNLGLNHSEYWLTDSPSPIGQDSIPGGYAMDAAAAEQIEYGHKFAVMSGLDAAGDFDAGRAHYAASDKNRLDWLVQSAGDITSVTTSGTYRLYRHDVQSADFASLTPGVPRALKINLSATDPTGLTPSYRYWLNYRMLPTNGIAGSWLPNGLQVDWRRDGNGFRAVQLDMTPYSRDTGPYGAEPGPYADNDDKEDAVLLIGRTFSDTAADIHFTPIAKGGTHPNQWLDVAVNIGTQGSNAAPQINSFTVSNATPTTGQVINFSVNATDPNGDPLAYHWDVGDNTVQVSQLNLSTRGKQWSAAGFYSVRVEVSDMKGGKASASKLIRVGSPADAGMIHGRVTQAGRPVESVLVRGGGVSAWTGSDGAYVLAGLPVGGVTVTALKEGRTFSPRFSNPVQVTEFNAHGIDFTANEAWTGGGGTVAVIRPYHIEVPLGFAVPFTAQAFDGSGNAVAFTPTWSVTGGGVIGSSSGLFEAQSLGGPFVVTAQSGSITTTATVTVLATAAGPATNGTWTNAAGGSWSTTGNWAGSPTGVIAGGAGFTANFNTLDITADATVNLDAARLIGSLVFGDTSTTSAAGWTVAGGTGGRFTLAGAAPTLTVNALGSGKFANITAPLHGINGFTKTGTGNLLLNNTNNTLSGPITMSGGNLQLNSASLSNATSVAVNAGTLVLATPSANAIGGTISFGGGTLQFNQNPGTDYSAQFSTADNQQYRISPTSGREAIFSTSLVSNGGSLTKLNTGTLVLAAANTYNGGTTINGGILSYTHASALGSGSISFTGNATLLAGVTATFTNAVSITTGITGTLDTNGTTTTLGGAITGAGTLTKAGAGTLSLTGGGAANTFSGPINVNAGTLSVDGINPSPTVSSFANMNGPITVAAGACFNFSQSFTADALDNNITLSGSGTGGLGGLNLWRNATMNGSITLAADATISHNFNNATISGPITGSNRTLTLLTIGSTQPGLLISGPISLGTGGIIVTAAGGTNTVTLSGNNSYSGETRVDTGKLRLTGSARLHDSSTVRIASGAVLHLDFTGVDAVGVLVLNGVTMPDGSHGSLTSTATHKSAFFEGNGLLQVGAASDFATWAALNNVSGTATGDHDLDGVPNLIEYALINGGERGTLSGTTITFNKRGVPYGNDLTCIIESSTELGASAVWTEVTGGSYINNASVISYVLPTGPTRLFVRLRVTSP